MKKGIFAESSGSTAFFGMIQALEEGKISRREKALVLVIPPWELDAQWYDYGNYWGSIDKQIDKIDKLIREYKRRTGLLK